MTWLPLFLFSCLLLAGCGGTENTAKENNPPEQAPLVAGGAPSLAEARRGFQTKLLRKEALRGTVREPPANLFRLVRYDAPVGKLAAYVSVPPQEGKKHPAIIWLVGGFSNNISATVWYEPPPENDQSARAFRNAGIVTMYPSLRGGTGNPGFKEGFYGEVDDVLAAADWLSRQDYVDPEHIYLGGHSTGGTLALLVAACPNRFRAIFSFGPVHEVRYYGSDKLPFDTSNERELELRSPIRWLHTIRTPVFVIEGQQGNAQAVQAMAEENRNPVIQFFQVRGANHFNILAPATRLLAEKIQRDNGATLNLPCTEQELNKLFAP
jgi:alpha/beta superfamily hydrolase